MESTVYKKTKLAKHKHRKRRKRLQNKRRAQRKAGASKK